jgi:glycosyltransferase involved in cell wall biosynthesis
VAGRILADYGREAQVVPPPVDTSYWTPAADARRDDYFLVAGRLVAYKRVDVAVRAAGLAGVRLVVAGDGPDLPRLRRLAGVGVEFVQRPERDSLRELYRRARALVVPGVEDFGMTMVEAQACGTPVVAYGVGGATEAVADGITGIHYAHPSPEHLASVLRRFDRSAYDGQAIRRHATRFDAAVFDAGIRAIVEGVVGADRGDLAVPWADTRTA